MMVSLRSLSLLVLVSSVESTSNTPLENKQEIVVATVAGSPMEKVLLLLEDLKAQVEGEGTAEATAYEEYACFCKDTTKKKI